MISISLWYDYKINTAGILYILSSFQSHYDTIISGRPPTCLSSTYRISISLWYDYKWKCFGCGAGGNVIFQSHYDTIISYPVTGKAVNQMTFQSHYDTIIRVFAKLHIYTVCVISISLWYDYKFPAQHRAGHRNPFQSHYDTIIRIAFLHRATQHSDNFNLTMIRL